MGYNYNLVFIIFNIKITFKRKGILHVCMDDDKLKLRIVQTHSHKQNQGNCSDNSFLVRDERNFDIKYITYMLQILLKHTRNADFEKKVRRNATKSC